MTGTAKLAVLRDRALIRLAGPDWRSFLQGLISQDVEAIAPGEVRYGALLMPQGRLLHDLFIWADGEGAILDVAADGRDGLLARLAMYRLRARVELAASPGEVRAAFGMAEPPGEAPAGWARDPRLAALGWRSVSASAAPPAAVPCEAGVYDAHRIAQGVGDLVRDGLADKAYAVEANLDLLNGVDFRKGCFVGQETTSRMKRRGVVKTRLVPIAFEGAPPDPGAEVLAGTLRAGEVASGVQGRALALLRLDRARAAELQVGGRAVRLAPPAWLAPMLEEAAAAST